MTRPLRVLADVAIIALLALGVAFVPGGGNAAQGAIAVLLIAFLATIAVAGRQVYRQNRLTIDTLPDRDRGVLHAGIGLLVLTIAAADKLLNTAGGTLIWIGMLALSVLLIARVWLEASRY